MNETTKTRWLTVLGACAFVFTAYSLGATWLGIVVWGFPVGMWLLGSGLLLAWTFGRTRPSDERCLSGDADSVLTRSPLPDITGWIAEWIVHAWRTLAVDSEGVEERVARWHDASGWPRRPLRIGVMVEPLLAQQLIDAPGFEDIEWYHAPDHDDECLERHRLDAVVHQHASGPVCVKTHEARDLSAAWPDWSTRRALTFASVFPRRVDPGAITLDEPDVLIASESELARTVIECGAILARSPGRLTLSDRFRGRRPTSRAKQRFDRLSRVQREPGLLEQTMSRLVEMIESRADTASPSATLVAAANATSAWLSTWDGPLSVPFRRRGIEAAACLVGDTPEMLLRLAAVRFADLDDNAAFQALLGAFDGLRRTNDVPSTDHLAMLAIEIDQPGDDPVKLGRIAAGICLACATLDPERVAYMREDVLDDVRFSAWLVGRDPDRQLLDQIFRTLESEVDEQSRLAA